MPHSFSKIEASLKRKGRRRFIGNALIALVLGGLAFFLYRHYF